MPIFFAIIILGIVQGLTEFLPVSSSGHLVLLSKFFGVEESLFLSIILHVATLLSIFVVLRKKILYYFKHPLSDGVRKLIVASIPTCIIVLLLMPILNQSFDGVFLPYCFMITSVILAATDMLFSNQVFKPLKKFVIDEKFSGITYKQAFFMGVAQGFAVFPGISRSGSTICAGVMAGGNKSVIAEFSFLMSIPIIILSLIKEVYEIITLKMPINVDVPSLIIAFLLAFIIGVFAIKIMINLTKKLNFLWFSIYLAALSILTFFII